MSSGESETRIRILETTWKLMLEQQGQGVRMSDIAKAAGISRQALYLHFDSRTELIVETIRYGDILCGIAERMRPWQVAQGGLEILETYIEAWGNYIPQIYGIAKALLAAKETDEAAAAAWNDRMQAVRDGCRYTIEALYRDGWLTEEWDCETATDLFWTMVSIRSWEQLTIECGWTNAQYVSWLQTAVSRIFVRTTPVVPVPGSELIPPTSKPDCL